MGKHRHNIGHLVTLNPLHILSIFHKLNDRTSNGLKKKVVAILYAKEKCFSDLIKEKWSRIKTHTLLDIIFFYAKNT